MDATKFSEEVAELFSGEIASRLDHEENDGFAVVAAGEEGQGERFVTPVLPTVEDLGRYCERHIVEYRAAAVGGSVPRALVEGKDSPRG